MQAFSATRARASQALVGALARMRSAIVFDSAQEGYVVDLSDNLVDGVTVEQVRRFFASAAGHEMDEKMRAAYSSSALAVNSFAPWLTAPGELRLASRTDFDLLEFEAVCPTGLRGTAPHLDVLLKSAECVMGVESKCLEYLDSHREQGFAEAYGLVLDRYPKLKLVAADVSSYIHLNAAQLVKHMLGLLHTYGGRPTLVYLFWEPVNWREWTAFADHRTEVRRFAEAIADGPVVFQAMTYRQLWDEWSLQAGPAWLVKHVEHLRDRYEVQI